MTKHRQTRANASSFEQAPVQQVKQGRRVLCDDGLVGVFTLNPKAVIDVGEGVQRPVVTDELFVEVASARDAGTGYLSGGKRR